MCSEDLRRRDPGHMWHCTLECEELTNDKSASVADSGTILLALWLMEEPSGISVERLIDLRGLWEKVLGLYTGGCLAV